MTDHPLLALGGLLGSTATTIAVAATPTSDEIEALAKLPVVIVLGIICCWLAWLLYKQGVDHRKGEDLKTQAMLEASRAHSAATLEISKSLVSLNQRMDEVHTCPYRGETRPSGDGGRKHHDRVL